MHVVGKIISMPGRGNPYEVRDFLESVGIPTDIVEAVDGMRLSPSDVAALVDEEFTLAQLGYLPSRPMIGCWMSHRRCYESLVSTPSEVGAMLILEDDVSIQVPEILDETARFILDSDEPRILHLYSRGIAVASPLSQRRDDGSWTFRYLFPPGQTAGYWINRAAARQALAHPLMSGPADWPAWSSQVQFWGRYPWMVREMDLPSSIGNASISRSGSWMRVLGVLLGPSLLRNWRFVAAEPKASLYLWLRTGFGLVQRGRTRLGLKGTGESGPLLLRGRHGRTRGR